MTILERIDQDFIHAMKTKDETRLPTLRLLRSATKNKQIDTQRPLTDEDVTSVIKTMVKQYQDALGDFEKAGRMDLFEKQKQEIHVLSEYLPPSLPKEELEAIVRDAVQLSGATDMGKAMGAAMKAVNGRADGTEVRAIVQRLLNLS